MKLLVTGKNGQVAACLAEVAANRADVDLVMLGRPEFDLAAPSELGRHIDTHRPDVVVSAAAYTAVDKAEDEPALAFAVNAAGAGAVSKASYDAGVPVIHLSTDYVFSGTKDSAYVETDPTGPQGVYGASKLEGERLVAAANPSHVILRTAWVYSAFGGNFVKTMLRLAGDRDRISVVCDQWGNPTSAHDIADGIIHVARAILAAPGDDRFGLFHLAGSGETNWSGLARHVLETSRQRGGPHADVRDIPTSEYPTRAKRPANSRLDTAKLRGTFGWSAPDWRQASAGVVARLLSADATPPRA